jgi:hypothetical protein
MDAIIAQVAEEKRIPLVTFDQLLADRISTSMKTITQENLKEEISPIEEKSNWKQHTQ